MEVISVAGIVALAIGGCLLLALGLWAIYLWWTKAPPAVGKSPKQQVIEIITNEKSKPAQKAQELFDFAVKFDDMKSLEKASGSYVPRALKVACIQEHSAPGRWPSYMQLFGVSKLSGAQKSLEEQLRKTMEHHLPKGGEKGLQPAPAPVEAWVAYWFLDQSGRKLSSKETWEVYPGVSIESMVIDKNNIDELEQLWQDTKHHAKSEQVIARLISGSQFKICQDSWKKVWDWQRDTNSKSAVRKALQQRLDDYKGCAQERLKETTSHLQETVGLVMEALASVTGDGQQLQSSKVDECLDDVHDSAAELARFNTKHHPLLKELMSPGVNFIGAGTFENQTFHSPDKAWLRTIGHKSVAQRGEEQGLMVKVMQAAKSAAQYSLEHTGAQSQGDKEERDDTPMSMFRDFILAELPDPQAAIDRINALAIQDRQEPKKYWRKPAIDGYSAVFGKNFYRSEYSRVKAPSYYKHPFITLERDLQPLRTFKGVQGISDLKEHWLKVYALLMANLPDELVGRIIATPDMRQQRSFITVLASSVASQPSWAIDLIEALGAIYEFEAFSCVEGHFTPEERYKKLSAWRAAMSNLGIGHKNSVQEGKSVVGGKSSVTVVDDAEEDRDTMIPEWVDQWLERYSSHKEHEAEQEEPLSDCWLSYTLGQLKLKDFADRVDEAPLQERGKAFKIFPSKLFRAWLPGAETNDDRQESSAKESEVGVKSSATVADDVILYEAYKKGENSFEQEWRKRWPELHLDSKETPAVRSLVTEMRKCCHHRLMLEMSTKMKTTYAASVGSTEKSAESRASGSQKHSDAPIATLQRQISEQKAAEDLLRQEIAKLDSQLSVAKAAQPEDEEHKNTIKALTTRLAEHNVALGRATPVREITEGRLQEEKATNQLFLSLFGPLLSLVETYQQGKADFENYLQALYPFDDQQKRADLIELIQESSRLLGSVQPYKDAFDAYRDACLEKQSLLDHVSFFASHDKQSLSHLLAILGAHGNKTFKHFLKSPLKLNVAHQAELKQKTERSMDLLAEYRCAYLACIHRADAGQGLVVDVMKPFAIEECLPEVSRQDHQVTQWFGFKSTGAKKEDAQVVSKLAEHQGQDDRLTEAQAKCAEITQDCDHHANNRQAFLQVYDDVNNRQLSGGGIGRALAKMCAAYLDFELGSSKVRHQFLKTALQQIFPSGQLPEHFQEKDMKELLKVFPHPLNDVLAEILPFRNLPFIIEFYEEIKDKVLKTEDIGYKSFDGFIKKTLPGKLYELFFGLKEKKPVIGKESQEPPRLQTYFETALPRVAKYSGKAGPYQLGVVSSIIRSFRRKVERFVDQLNSHKGTKKVKLEMVGSHSSESIASFQLIFPDDERQLKVTMKKVPNTRKYYTDSMLRRYELTCDFSVPKTQEALRQQVIPTSCGH